MNVSLVWKGVGGRKKRREERNGTQPVFEHKGNTHKITLEKKKKNQKKKSNTKSP